MDDGVEVGVWKVSVAALAFDVEAEDAKRCGCGPAWSGCGEGDEIEEEAAELDLAAGSSDGGWDDGPFGSWDLEPAGTDEAHVTHEPQWEQDVAFERIESTEDALER